MLVGQYTTCEQCMLIIILIIVKIKLKSVQCGIYISKCKHCIIIKKYKTIFFQNQIDLKYFFINRCSANFTCKRQL